MNLCLSLFAGLPADEGVLAAATRPEEEAPGHHAGHEPDALQGGTSRGLFVAGVEENGPSQESGFNYSLVSKLYKISPLNYRNRIRFI